MTIGRTVVGVDTAKRVFQLHWVDTETGEIVDLKLTRPRFLEQDPLARQLTHFCSVIRGNALPMVTARDGLQNLRVTEAVVESARTGQTVNLM